MTDSASSRSDALVDLDDALADADYQLQLLAALKERARRHERANLGALSPAAITALASFGLVIGTLPYGIKRLFDVGYVDLWATAGGVFGLIITTASFILGKRESARLDRILLEAEEARLLAAISSARREVADRLTLVKKAVGS